MWYVDHANLRSIVNIHCIINKYLTGIRKVEELAREAQREILRGGLHRIRSAGLKPRLSDFLDEGEIIELLTRIIVKERFIGALEETIRMAPLRRLKDALFEYAYPTPPQEWC